MPIDYYRDPWQPTDSDQVQMRVMRTKADLLLAIRKHLRGSACPVTELAQQLDLLSGDVEALLEGKMGEFSFEELVSVAHRLGLGVNMVVKDLPVASAASK